MNRTDTLTSANVIFSSKHFVNLLSISAKELLGVRLCPSRRSWTICPARARPSWTIRGACPLHDLMEVLMEEEKNEEDTMKASASARTHQQAFASVKSILPSP
jgi:hypothetical protein